MGVCGSVGVEVGLVGWCMRRMCVLEEGSRRGEHAVAVEQRQHGGRRCLRVALDGGKGPGNKAWSYGPVDTTPISSCLGAFLRANKTVPSLAPAASLLTTEACSPGSWAGWRAGRKALRSLMRSSAE